MFIIFSFFLNSRGIADNEDNLESNILSWTWQSDTNPCTRRVSFFLIRKKNEATFVSIENPFLKIWGINERKDNKQGRENVSLWQFPKNDIYLRKC